MKFKDLIILLLLAFILGTLIITLIDKGAEILKMKIRPVEKEIQTVVIDSTEQLDRIEVKLNELGTYDGVIEIYECESEVEE